MSTFWEGRTAEEGGKVGEEEEEAGAEPLLSSSSPSSSSTSLSPSICSNGTRWDDDKVNEGEDEELEGDEVDPVVGTRAPWPSGFASPAEAIPVLAVAEAGRADEERGELADEEEAEDEDSREGEDESSVEDDEVVDDEDDESDTLELFRRRLCFLDRFERRLSLFVLRCFALLSGVPFECESSPLRLSSSLSARSSVVGLSLSGFDLSAVAVTVAGAWKAEEAVRRLLPIEDATGVADGETSREEEEDGEDAEKREG